MSLNPNKIVREGKATREQFPGSSVAFLTRDRLVLLFFGLLTAVPLLAGWFYSLSYSVGLAGVFRKGFTLEHWQRLLDQSSSSGQALGTLTYTACLALVSILIIVFLALLLSHQLVFASRNGSLYSWLFLPLTLPPVVAAFVFFELLSPAGLLSRLSYHFGWIASLEEFPRLVNDAASLGIIITQVFLLFPFFTLVFVHQARQEDLPALKRVALSLGAGNTHFFRRVYAPVLLKRGLPLILLYAVYLFGTYEIPLLLGRSSPRVVTVYITEQLTRFDLNNIPLGHAMAAIYSLLVVVFLLFWLNRKQSQFR